MIALHGSKYSALVRMGKHIGAKIFWELTTGLNCYYITLLRYLVSCKFYEFAKPLIYNLLK